MSEQVDDYDEELDEALCICSGTTKRKVLQLIDDGVDTLDAISRKTGAYSGCGGCEFELEQIIEEYHEKK